MLKHFIELGRWRKGGTGEESMANEIFQMLRNGLGREGRFFKKSAANGELVEVTDDVAHNSEYPVLSWLSSIEDCKSH